MAGPWEKYAPAEPEAPLMDEGPWKKYGRVPTPQSKPEPPANPSFLDRLRAGGTELPPEAAAMRPTATPQPAPEDRAGVHERLNRSQEIIKGAGGDPRQSPQVRELAKEQAAGVAQNDREAATLIAPYERGLAGLRGPDIGRMTAAVTAPVKKALSWIFEIDPEKAATAAEVAKRGQAVAPGGYMKAPRLQRNVDLARSFHYDPMEKGAQETVQAGAQGALEKSGLTPEEATAERARLAKVEKPDPEAAGEAIKGAARADRVAAASELNARIGEVRAGAEATGRKAQEAHARDLATNKAILARTEKEIDQELEAGWKKVQAIREIRDPKLLSEAMAGTVQAMRRRVMDQAESRYALADRFAGGEKIPVTGARVVAKDFIEQLPEDLQRNMPALMKTLSEMETGEMTFGQLHYLRSQLRDLGYLDNEKLPPSFRRGPFKHLANVVDHIIHDQKDNPALSLAAKALDSADAYYAKEMARFKDATVQGFVDNLKAGMPPDPVAIARQVVQAGANHSSRLREILNIAGPKVAEKIRSADYDDILRMSRHPLSGEIDTKELLAQVEARRKNGTLDLLWGKEAARTIEREVRKLAARAGDIPIERLPPDQFAAALTQANALGDRIKELAKVNPVKMMEDALKEGQNQAKALTKGFKEAQKEDILGGLANPKVMATHAAEQLLKTENTPMLEAAIMRWGENSEAVQRLRQFAIEKTLAPVLRGEDPVQLIQHFAGMTRKQIDLLFPKGMADDLIQMVKELKTMYGDKPRTVPAFAAGEILDQDLKKGGLRQYYRITMAWAVTHPTFVRSMAAMVKQGGVYREEAKRELDSLVARLFFASYASEGGWQEEEQAPVAKPQSWRDLPKRTGTR